MGLKLAFYNTACANITSTSHFPLLFCRKSHLTPIVTQDRDDGHEDDHHDEINRVGYLKRKTTPKDEDDLENKEEDRKLNFSFYKKSELQSIIYPPSKEPCEHGKGRGDRSQNEKVETGNFKGRIFKDEVEKDKEGGGRQKGNGKMNNHRVRMASSHRESLEEILKSGRKVFQLLGCSFLQNPRLGISLKHFCSVGGCGDLSRKILA